MIDISIVLGTYNRKELLMPCIRSVQQSAKGLDYEIIINDAGSTDGTLDILKRWSKIPRFTIIFSGKRTSPTQAYNQCFRAMTGKYVIWFSDDLVAENDSIVEMFNFMEEQDEKTIAAFYVKNSNQQNMIKAMLAHQQKLNLSEDEEEKEELQGKVDRIKKSLGYSVPEHKGQLCPSVACISSNYLRQLGLWNTDYPYYGQDVDLNFRILRDGGKIVGCKKTQLIHNMVSDDLRVNNVREGRKSANDKKFILISQRFGEKIDKLYPKILFKLENDFNENLLTVIIKKLKTLFRNSHLYYFSNKEVKLQQKALVKADLADPYDLIINVSKNSLDILFPDDLDFSIKNYILNMFKIIQNKIRGK
jgi:GT2 family glycosyltransferase